MNHTVQTAVKQDADIAAASGRSRGGALMELLRRGELGRVMLEGAALAGVMHAQNVPGERMDEREPRRSA